MAGATVIEVDDLERDALIELANIGVGRAAVNLRELVGHEVVLSVPALAILRREEVAQIVGRQEVGGLVAVHQAFSGPFCGRIVVIFPEANSLELVQAVGRRAFAIDDIVELEAEALIETGNIILNGYLSTFANLLQRSLSVSLPELIRGGGSNLIETLGPLAAEDPVLLLYIDFSINQLAIKGYIAMLMDLPSLGALRQLLQDFIARSVDGIRPPSHADS